MTSKVLGSSPVYLGNVKQKQLPCFERIGRTSNSKDQLGSLVRALLMTSKVLGSSPVYLGNVKQKQLPCFERIGRTSNSKDQSGSLVRALLMTSKVLGSSPGGPGVFFSFQADTVFFRL